MGWAGRAGWAVWAGGPRAGLGGWLARVGVGGGGEGLWGLNGAGISSHTFNEHSKLMKIVGAWGGRWGPCKAAWGCWEGVWLAWNWAGISSHT